MKKIALLFSLFLLVSAASAQTYHQVPYTGAALNALLAKINIALDSLGNVDNTGKLEGAVLYWDNTSKKWAIAFPPILTAEAGYVPAFSVTGDTLANGPIRYSNGRWLFSGTLPFYTNQAAARSAGLVAGTLFKTGADSSTVARVNE